MAGKVEEKAEQKPKQRKTVAAQPSPVQPVAQAASHAPAAKSAPEFEHISNIPKIFCADRNIAKGLLVDLFAMIGTLNAIETGNVDVDTLPLVLQNSQRILTNLSDVMIRDCGVTDSDLEDVMNIFAEVSKEAAQQVTTQSPHAKVIAVEQKKEQRTGTEEDFSGC